MKEIRWGRRRGEGGEQEWGGNRRRRMMKESHYQKMTVASSVVWSPNEQMGTLRQRGIPQTIQIFAFHNWRRPNASSATSYNLCERILFIDHPDDKPSVNYFHHHEVMAPITVLAKKKKKKKKKSFCHLKYLRVYYPSLITVCYFSS